jgi:3D (Asp-Asp-Asp) domain-containing protein
VLVTGYCNCEKCCGWKKSWFGFGKPVYDYGPNKGRPKKVGVTASGIVASAGTVAADPKVFKFGTRLEIPGYGIGRVEDVGGAIKGRHIDLWFPSHKEALKWGRRWLKVVPVAGGKGI